MISRATDPKNVELIGIPPIDLLEDVKKALIEAGMDYAACFRRACEVTGEWKYTPSLDIRDSFTPQRTSEFTVPVKARKLVEILDPQPRASAVIRKLLGWIDRVDIASQHGAQRPVFATPGGGPIFPEDEDPWWLTELSRRKNEEKAQPAPGDEDGPAASEHEGPEDDAITNDSDPLSEDGASLENPPEHVPEIAWLY